MYPKELFLGISLYEIFVMIAMVAALFLADRMATKSGFSVKLQRQLIYGAIGAILVGFLGAVLFQAVYDFIETGVWNIKSGMTFYGGLLFGAGTFLIIWFFLSKPFGIGEEAKRRFLDIANIAACVVSMAHGIGRLGCLFAGCCHGQKTNAWYGITHYAVDMQTGELISLGKYVPTQLFEAVFLLALSALLFWLYFKKNNAKIGNGTWAKIKDLPLLPVYMIVYGVWRFFIEYARGDDRGQTIVPFLTPSQLIAVLLVLGGVAYFLVWYFVFQKRKTSAEPQTIEEAERAEKLEAAEAEEKEK